VAERQHRLDPEGRPYDPAHLARKDDVEAAAFFALDLRVGRVVAVEDFPEARDPSYRVSVDFGPVIGTLRTSAKITNYTHDELQDRLVVGALNLGTRRIAGFKSEFLIIGGLTPDGTVHLLEVDASLEPGAPVA
jgi:tRNA-binding protein